jgi:putative transposase
LTYSPEPLVADTSLSGQRVARDLDVIGARRGLLLTVVSDNGTEPTGVAILGWSQQRAIDWHYIAPGEPQQNAFAELHWPPAGRMPQREPVHLTAACPGRAGELAA